MESGQETAELTALRLEIASLRERVNYLDERFLQYSQLPDLKFVDGLLGEALQEAKEGVAEFLGASRPASNSDAKYLLHQMMFRGSTDVIHEYLGRLVDSIPKDCLATQVPIVDLGCGRGELLQTLKSRGAPVLGVDTNELLTGELRACGIEVRSDSALSYLKAIDNDSVGGVCGFHLIEHLQPDYFHELLEVAFQKTLPGGFILLETPNPYCFESLSFFYTDDTHVRPIQPTQLAFWVESTGYQRTRSHFSAPAGINDRMHEENWMRHYQNHGIIGFKPEE